MTQVTATHTFKRFDGELAHLHWMVTEMGAAVSVQLEKAMEAFRGQDYGAARAVIEADRRIDQLEASGDAEILQLIARHAPQASDLRRVIAVSKSITDLEQVGDEAVRIASLLFEMGDGHPAESADKLGSALDEVAARAFGLLKRSLLLFEAFQMEDAIEVIEGHQQMDGHFQRSLHDAMRLIRDEQLSVGLAVSHVLVAKSLDRIAHHALNLAEYALFERSGEDLRTQQPRESQEDSLMPKREKT
jgi:phosphate transport system protein